MKGNTYIRFAISAAVFMVFVIGLALLVNAKQNHKSDHELVSATYLGTMKTVHGDSTYSYNVRISEVDRGYGLSRGVHLTPAADCQFTNMPSITGHGGSTDDSWYYISYGDYKLGSGTNAYTAGFSNVRLEDSGNWRWEPCGYDVEHGLQPFTPEQILFAKMEFDQAVAEIRNPKHLVEHVFWVEKTKRCTPAKVNDARPVGL